MTSLKTSTRLLAALPPENTTSLRFEVGTEAGLSLLEVGKRDITESMKRDVGVAQTVKKSGTLRG